jgi:hypothetical protein
MPGMQKKTVLTAAAGLAVLAAAIGVGAKLLTQRQRES